MRLLLFFLLSLAGLTACQPSGTTGLSGTLTFGDRPLAGASVEIYLKAEKDRSVQPFAVTSTDPEGHYRLELPPGRYFVIGKQRRSSDDGRPQMLMAECPTNPVEVVAGGLLEVPTFSLREMGRDGRLVAEAGTFVDGRVVRDATGVAGAFVYVYTEPEADLMGPSYAAVVETAADGSFRIALPAGQFWLAARKRVDGARLGEPKPGDLTGSLEQAVSLASGQILEVGDLVVRPVDAGRYRERQAAGKFVDRETAFTGKILDQDGEPVAGIYVFAYLDSRMVGKPTYISDPSAADGSYRLNLGRGGRYYLGARSAYGGPLEPGEWVGTYDKQAEHRADVESGQIVDLGPLQVREVW